MSVKHDWYQNDEKVVVTVLLKNAVDKNYKCEIESEKVHLSAENYELILELLNPVVPEKSSHRATPHKVEITLVKRDFGKWTMLEKKQEVKTELQCNTKSKKPQDWDKLAKEVEKTDDAEGDAAVNALFKKIYESGTEEQRRAMNKSFQESGGTVLSTNWNEVKKDKVEVKPPDGTEFKHF
ncbi:protein SGT1 homolog [Chironomus tepperi]|uniref:protein SGT1 homolog n=1 Tax=Chironomus tepperi TaxID=113505 RepID=UPI00391F12D5